MSNDSFNAKLRFGQKRERYVVEKLVKNGYSVEIYKNVLDLDWLGDEIYNQDIFVKGNTYQCPDIQIFTDDNLGSVVFRVEVKSFIDIEKYSYQFGNTSVVGIAKSAFDNYVDFQRVDETDCIILFVIGDEECYDFYWEHLPNLQKIKHKEGNLYDRNDGYFWRIQDLKEGMNSFIKELKRSIW